jgi:hypothetical protein
MIIDSTTDQHRAAWVALVTCRDEKPRLYYGTGRHIPHSTVELWGINAALRRLRLRYGANRSIVVTTDCKNIADTRGNMTNQYVWVSRNNRLLRHMHSAARALRLSMPGCCKKRTRA